VFRQKQITCTSSSVAKSKINNTKILILCAGDGTRWDNYLGVPKQLIPINGEPLLNRTLRLLCDHGYNDIAIIAHDNRLNLKGVEFFKPPQFRWTIETLLSTQPLWAEKTIVLLGDVFYTNQALATILSSNQGVHVYGRHGQNLFTYTPHGELFAISFEENDHYKMKKHLNIARSDAFSGGRGKIWEFYRSLAGFPLNEHKKPLNEQRKEDEIFISIHDLTDDIDRPKEYDKVIKRYSYAASNNPLKRVLINCWIYGMSPLKKFLRPVRNYFLQLINK